MFFSTTVGILALVLSSVPTEASQMLSFNNDAQCSSTFENVQVKSINCYSSSSFVSVSGNNQVSEGCQFGDMMEIEGEVTLTDSVYPYFDVRVELCQLEQGQDAQESTSWWKRMSSGCKSYKTKVDLRAENSDNAWLSSGAQTWRASVKLPKKGLSSYNEYTISAFLSFKPKKTYKTEDSTFTTAKNWQCSSTFTVTNQQQVAQYYSATAAVALLCLGGIVSAVYRKRRISSVDLTPMQDDIVPRSNFESIA